jgi:PAS domain S-box-containing protein
MSKLAGDNPIGPKMQSKEGIEALFLYATEGILVVNEKGEIIRINPSAEKLFGYDAGELLGKPIEVLVPKSVSGRHYDHRDKYNQHPHARSMGAGIELFGLRKDGREFPVEISLSPYHNDEGKYVIAFIVDITFRKEAETRLKNYSADLEKQVRNRTMILNEAVEELEKTKKNLYDALEKERELNELKSRFVSMASHEFRTPLATILSSVSLVTKYGELNEKEKQHKHIVRIKSSISDLTDILNDFLSLSKLEEGKVECILEKFNIREFISEINAEMQSLAKENQKINYKHTGTENIALDKKLLKNILFNLISNAIKFSPEEKPVDISTEYTGKHIKIAVKDHGMGIPLEDQKHLFERFFRGHNATHIQGTGLGLNIVAKYVELMNGSITFESKENKGTSFMINFPQ